MHSTTCVRCGSEHRANRSLTSLRFGRKFVFDRALGRVWTICSHCGEWNLSGPESAKAFISEVVSQLDLRSTPEGPVGYFTLGECEVLAVDQTGAESLPSRSGLVRYQQLRRWSVLHWAGPVAVYGVMIAAQFGADLFTPARWSGAQIQLVTAMVAGVALSRPITAVWLRRQGSTISLMIGITLSAALVLGFPWREETFTLDTIVVLALVGMWAVGTAAVDVWMPSRLTRPEGAPHRPVDLQHVALIHLNGSELGLQSRRLRPADKSGLAAVRALAEISEITVTEANQKALDDGWILSRTYRTPQRLLRALADSSPDGLDRFEWDELPIAWKVAFHIVCVEAAAPSTENGELHRRLAKAGSVAAYAERLSTPE
jgi:hypothetical protein